MNYLRKIGKYLLRDELRKMNENIRTRFADELSLTPSDHVEPDDVVVVGYPKSGNTWFQNLIAGVVYGVNVRNLPIGLVHQIVPDLGVPYYRRYYTPMYFKSHQLPNPKYRRVVYLVRDGRDIIVSYYHFLQAMGQSVTWEQLIREGSPNYGSWQEHVQSWMKNPYDAEMITIRYEDLLTSPVDQMKKFCQFVGVERDTDHLSWAVDNASFEKMSQREKKFGMPGGFPSDKKFMRQGKSDTHDEDMPPAVIAEFTTIASDMLERFGYIDS